MEDEARSTAPGAVLRVEVEGGAPRSTVAVHGEVDVSTAGQLAAAVAEARHAGCTELAVDLGGVTFMDLSGLRILHAAAADGVAVVVRRPTRLVRRVIDLSGLGDLLAVEGHDEVG